MSGSFEPAKPNSRSSRNRLNERKQMSTKTSIKRIALVAVSALGFGILTSIAPANAAVTGVSAGTPQPARVGVWSAQTLITVSSGAGAAAQDISAQITAAPTGSTLAGLKFVSGATLSLSRGVALTSEAEGVNYNISTATNQLAADGIAIARYTSTANATEVVGLEFNADVAGSYTILVTADSAVGYAAGKFSTSYTITTAGAPTSMTLSAINGTTYDADIRGSLVKVILKDAAGAATTLGLNETLNLTAATGSAVTSYITPANAYLTSADFLRGFALFRVTQDVAADETDVITVSGAGTLLSSFNGQTSIKILVTDALEAGDTLNAAANNASLLTYKADLTSVSPTATGYGLRATVATPATGGLTGTYSTFATITDVSGLKTGVPGAIYTVGIAAAKGATSISVPSVGVALGVGGQITMAFEGTTRTYTGTAASATFVVGDIAPGTVASATGATNTFTSKITNDYGAAVAGAAIVGKIKAGRNSASTAVNLLSDANGFVTYTIKDAGTTGLTDTVSLALDAVGTGEKTATISYATAAVSTVVLSGGNTTAGVTSSVPSPLPIEADDTPESATTGIAATVKDANGVLLAGIPVVFTLTQTDGAAFTTTTATSYTLSTGVATANLYAWKAGTYNITATAGGKTGTATATFSSQSAAFARTISAVVSGDVITATVLDRFSNPVSGVTVYAVKKSGDGSFAGVTRTNSATDATGTVDFVYNGKGTVEISTINYAVVGAIGSGQTCARAGFIDCNDDPADDTAFTATTAGTTTVNAKNVGSSIAPAGVSKVSVTVDSNTAVAAANAATAAAEAAADAAAEAIDAANAATDAANLSAEAADAATVAAEEARDAADAATAAVEELATQVATLMAALKAQITTLANTVAKIAKKVRA